MSLRLKKSELFKYEGHYVSRSKYQVKSACNSVPALIPEEGESYLTWKRSWRDAGFFWRKFNRKRKTRKRRNKKQDHKDPICSQVIWLFWKNLTESTWTESLPEQNNLQQDILEQTYFWYTKKNEGSMEGEQQIGNETDKCFCKVAKMQICPTASSKKWGVREADIAGHGQV